MTKGFTLIELLVVVLIIGILSAVALPQYQKAVDKARFSEAFVQLKAIWQAQRACRLQNSDPAACNSFEEFDVTFPNPNPTGRCDGSWCVETKDFQYSPSGTTDKPVAWYKKYDVCVCMTEDGELIGSNHGSSCAEGEEPPYNVIKSLGIRDVTNDGSSCWMC